MELNVSNFSFTKYEPTIHDDNSLRVLRVDIGSVVHFNYTTPSFMGSGLGFRPLMVIKGDICK